MKKLLLLLLIAPVIGLGQVLTDVLYLTGYGIEGDYRGLSLNGYTLADGTIINAQTSHNQRTNKYVVPENKLWKIVEIYRGNLEDGSVFSNKLFNTGNITLVFANDNFLTTSVADDLFFTHQYSDGDAYFLKSGTEFWVAETKSYKLVVYEYSFDSNSLSYNEPKTIKNNSNTPVLFPNPTSSLLALNSDKEYDIEVYDMAGNKVMALRGNTIDMSHLSSATYIVKALDKVENEEVSYKVVKN
jgi:hypothetical protein